MGIEFLVFVSTMMSSEWTGKGKYYYLMFFVLVSMGLVTSCDQSSLQVEKSLKILGAK